MGFEQLSLLREWRAPRRLRHDNEDQVAHHGKEHALGSRDFRFKPDTGELDAQSGPSQFGRNPDDWGDWFGVQNSWPLWHYVLQEHYIRRNPHVPAPDPIVQVVTPKNSPVLPTSPLEKRFHSSTRRATSQARARA
ncbi:MAG: hypothetical protein EXS27_07830 [Pedosphaera sp.]|nr:hypothetical protein [Pedosphaera sp.]